MKGKHLFFTILIVGLLLALAACAPKSTSTPAPVSTSATAASGATQPAATQSSPSAKGDCANDYYPVANGNYWTYSSTGAKGAVTVTQTLSQVNSSDFMMDYNVSNGVDAKIKWTCQSGNLSALDVGSAGGFSLTTASQIQLDSTSATSDGYNIPAVLSSGTTWSQKESVNATVTEKGTTKTITSQIAYTLNCTAGAEESVTVPAGTFNAVRASCTKDQTLSATISGKTMQINDNKESLTYWYAKGVGFIKSVSTGGADNQTIVLTQYKLN